MICDIKVAQELKKIPWYYLKKKAWNSKDFPINRQLLQESSSTPYEIPGGVILKQVILRGSGNLKNSRAIFSK